MSNLYRGPSIDASYQVSYHLAKRFQRKSCFRNRPIRNNNCLWWPCFLTDQNRMSNSYRGPSIDVSYHVSVHLAKLFQSSRFLEIDQSETRIYVMLINGSGQNEHSLQRNFHRCFLPSFGSFGKAVSQEKIFRNQPIRNKNCPWRPYLLMDRDKMSNLNREDFQKSNNQKQELPGGHVC